jgi:hypothetical protein
MRAGLCAGDRSASDHDVGLTQAPLQKGQVHASFPGPGCQAGSHAPGSQLHLLGHVGGSAAALN